jgi:hypothetical protein
MMIERTKDDRSEERLPEQFDTSIELKRQVYTPWNECIPITGS